MFAVGTGYNSLFVTLGVFDSKEALEKTIQEMGARFVPKQTRKLAPGNLVNGKDTYTIKEYWEVTEEFEESMDNLGLSHYEMDGLPLEIREIKSNTICFGYDTD